jgi:DNA-directed RNA polymerase specialized sigma24 family protein
VRDAREFDAFYVASSRRVLGQLYAMIGDRAEAEDAVSEAYLRAWTAGAPCATAEARRHGYARWRTEPRSAAGARR